MTGASYRAEDVYPGRPWPRPRRAAAPRGPALHLLLLVATFVTTTMSGAALSVGVPALLARPDLVYTGVPYAVALMGILLAHESGHYVTARRHGVSATLPYFAPGPPFLPTPGFDWLPGTFGAFIRLRTLPPSRAALFDIGAAGPWAGFLVAIPVVVIGLLLSEVKPLDPTTGGWALGESLLFSWLTRAILGVDPDNAMILLHPVALAGWFGFLVTALNLLPAGQLDGGHVLYAALGRHHRRISRAVVVGLIAMGIFSWPGWIMWAVILLALGLGHPPPTDPVAPLDRRRLLAAAATAVVFALTFIPEPITFVEPRVPPRFPGELIPVSAPSHGAIVLGPF